MSLIKRRSRYTLLGKVISKQAEEVADTTVGLLTPHRAHTEMISADNGKEFAAHSTIGQALGATVYFAHPNYVWARGLNANANGLIHQYVAKGMALDTPSEKQVQNIMDRLNHRPRKGLAFQTQHEILYQETGLQPEQPELHLQVESLTYKKYPQCF